jgi:hypothetical protein
MEVPFDQNELSRAGARRSQGKGIGYKAMTNTRFIRSLGVIAAILLAIAATVVIAQKGIRQVRASSKHLECARNLQRFGIALLTYAHAVSGSGDDLVQQMVTRGFVQQSDTTCPITGEAYRSFTLPPVYAIPRPSETIVAYEPLGQHRADAAMVVFADGHSELVPDREFALCMANTSKLISTNSPPPNADKPAN